MTPFTEHNYYNYCYCYYYCDYFLLLFHVYIIFVTMWSVPVYMTAGCPLCVFGSMVDV